MNQKAPVIVSPSNGKVLESGRPAAVRRKRKHLALKVLAGLVLLVVGFGVGFWFKTFTYKDDRANQSKFIKAETHAYNQSDIDILQYALILENLEYEFYQEGLNNFTASDFTTAGFSNDTFARFEEIRGHEKGHVDALNKTITATGQVPNPACNYSFPYTDVKSFVALARQLERTGVSAYDGVIHQIIDDGYKTTGAAIATVEARHAAFLNYVSGLSPFPSLFDTPIGPTAIVGIAAGLIKSCPFKIPIMPYPSFTSTPPNGTNGTTLTISSTPNATYCAFLTGLDQVWTEITNLTCLVPLAEVGDSYVFLTSDNSTKIELDSQGSIVAGPIVFSLTK